MVLLHDRIAMVLEIVLTLLWLVPDEVEEAELVIRTIVDRIEMDDH